MADFDATEDRWDKQSAPARSPPPPCGAALAALLWSAGCHLPELSGRRRIARTEADAGRSASTGTGVPVVGDWLFGRHGTGIEAYRRIGTSGACR
jgi:hypothetical protein